MYVRNKTTGQIGDVTSIHSHCVTGIAHDTERPFEWPLGEGNIEFIEFGSFNAHNDNYVKNGKILYVK